MVWSPPLQDDSEGPTLIDYTVTQNESPVADSFCSWHTQNISFKANCIERGPPIWYSGLRTPSEFASVAVACPKVLWPKFGLTFPKFGMIEDVESLRSEL